MTGRSATVWCAERRVGALREVGQRMQFTYDPSWIGQGGLPISLSLELTSVELDAHDFFAGILPEAQARRRACREHRLDDADDFGLLLAIGRDCAGVLSVLPEGEEPGQTPTPLALSAEDLAALVESRGVALPQATESQRFSLAGAQDKVAVRVEGEKMWLPDPIHPSSHILKFETHKRVCLAEYLGHDLARRLGLDVVATSYRELEDGTPYLLVERYDRAVDDAGRRFRLHQEDVTQALGYPPALKYEGDGGPSLADVANLIRRRTAEPVRDIARLRDWQLYNYFIGNYDGHAKNLALLYPAGCVVPVLAPHYDLVSLEFLYRIGIRYARTLAFRVADKSTPEEIRREDWQTFAQQIGVPARRLLQRLREMASLLPALASDTRAAFAAQFGDNQVLDRFEETLRDRCSWTLASSAM